MPNENNSLTFEPATFTFSAPAGNEDPVVIFVEDKEFSVPAGEQLTVINIDIKPGSYPNSINLKSKGTIPVAILSTVGFDAPSLVDRKSLTFGKTGDELSLDFCSPSPKDVNNDGLGDLICHFTSPKTGFQTGDTQGTLKGEKIGGGSIEAKDSVKIVP